MTGDDDRVSDVDRRSMRILATSTKAAGPANARIADRLERAAGTGDPEDYRKAEASFDSLPANERRRIGTHAEKQAETQRQLEEARRRKAAEPQPPKRAPAVDDTLDWKPLMLSHSPATDPIAARDPILTRGTERRPATPPSPPRASVPRPAMPGSPGSHSSGAGAAAQRGPGKPGVPGRPAAAAGAGSAAGTAPAPPPPPRPKKPLVTLDPVAAANGGDDPEKGWDWQRIPEDPVLKSKRKKPAALDPIEELRRQMLGEDDKRR